MFYGHKQSFDMTSIRVAAILVISALSFSSLAQEPGGRLLDYPEVEPSRTAFVEYSCHVQDYGDTDFFKQPVACGAIGRHKRIEGFKIRLANGSENVGLTYMAHIAKQGDTGWTFLNQFVGIKGKKLAMEGVAIKVTGPAANKYDVYYMVHMAEHGNSEWCRNGDFCGTRGQGRRVEAIAIYLADKDAKPLRQ